MLNKRLFLYNDSRIVGGHELLTAQIVNRLVDQHGVIVHFAYYCDELTQHLSPNVMTSRLPFHGKSLNPYHLLRRDILLVKRTVSQFKPDLAVISQGYIESGLRGLIACRLAGVKTGSYIPFGHTNRELDSKYARLRDSLSRPIFALNQFYITISTLQSSLLERLISNQPIYVINNPVAAQPTTPRPPVDISESSSKPLNIAVVGRVLFKQKNQDILVPVAKRLAAEGVRTHFHIVGDGPDTSALIERVTSAGCSPQFTFHNWLDKAQLANFIAQKIDLVLIPSHYEGLPLVFLEAIYLGKPVLVSKMPFLCDYPMPESYLVDARSEVSIATKISQIHNTDNIAHVLELQKSAQETNSFERFSRDIEESFQSLFEA